MSFKAEIEVDCSVTFIECTIMLFQDNFYYTLISCILPVLEVGMGFTDLRWVITVKSKHLSV